MIYVFVSYAAINATRSGALEVALSNAKTVASDGWNSVAPQVYVLQREASERFTGFKQKYFLEKGVGTYDAKSMMPVPVKSCWEGLGRFGHRFGHPRKGMLAAATLI